MEYKKYIVLVLLSIWGDTEKSLTLHEIQIVFPSSAVYCYTVDISDDKQQWLTVSDKQNTTKSEQ